MASWVDGDKVAQCLSKMVMAGMISLYCWLTLALPYATIAATSRFSMNPLSGVYRCSKKRL